MKSNCLFSHSTMSAFSDPYSSYKDVSSQGMRDNSFLFVNHEDEETSSFIIEKSAIKIIFNMPILKFIALSELGQETLKHYFKLEKPTECHEVEITTSDPISFTHPALEEVQKFMAYYEHRFAILFGFEFYDTIENLKCLPADSDTIAQLTCLVPERYSLASTATNTTINTELQLIYKTTLSQEQSNKLNKPIISQPDFDTVNVTPSDKVFANQVEQAKKYIKKGDAFQVVISRKFKLNCKNPMLSFEKLTQQNPSTYHYYMNCGDNIIFGASPETSVKVSQRNKLKTLTLHPIAGTMPRGRNEINQIDAVLDQKNENALKSDPKELAEHMMLVDLARNDAAKISKPGTTKVVKLKQISKYKQVMHMYSIVQSELDEHYNAFSAFAACLNMGTLSGAPKVSATQIIKTIEQSPRGCYGGAIGWVGPNDECDSAIIIRTAVVKENIATIQAGAGIVYDSDPINETNETSHKAKAVIEAIVSANEEVTTNVSA